jgi:hypothetical protein
MKPIVTPDKRRHELNATEQRTICRTIEIVEKLAAFYRKTFEGTALEDLADKLMLVAQCEKLVEEAPDEEPSS